MKLKLIGVFIFVIGCTISYKAGILKATYDFSRAMSRACNGDEECIKALVKSAELGDKIEKGIW